MQIKKIILDDIAKYEFLLGMNTMSPANERIVLDILVLLRNYTKQARSTAQFEKVKAR